MLLPRSCSVANFIGSGGVLSMTGAFSSLNWPPGGSEPCLWLASHHLNGLYKGHPNRILLLSLYLHTPNLPLFEFALYLISSIEKDIFQ